jgi:hypothetical protein
VNINIENLAIPILEILTPIVTALLGWISYRLAAWIKAKTKNEKLSGVMLRFGDAISTLVKEAEQTIVSEMKRAKSPDSPDGAKLSPEEAAGVRLAVVAKFRKLWGEKGIKEIETVLGVERESIMPFIESKLEEAVHELKTK